MADITDPQKLLDLLYSLYRALHGPGETSMIEKYNYFVNHSTYGRDCAYSTKCQFLFYANQYPEVRRLLIEAAELANKVKDD